MIWTVRTAIAIVLWIAAGLLTLFLWLKRWDIEVAPPEEQQIASRTFLTAVS